MALSHHQQNQLLEAALAYVRRGGADPLHVRLSQRYGPIGALLGYVVEIFQGGMHKASERDLVEAIELLTRSGFDVRPGGAYTVPPPIQTGATPPPIPFPPPRRPPPVGPVSTVPQPGQRRPIDQWPPEMDLDTRTILAPLIDDGSEDDVFSNMIQTPQSSNVYAFGYDKHAGILYVQYKAGGPAVFTENKVSTCSDRIYRMGHRAHVPGPIYAYGSAARKVPESIFEGMKTAHSKGQFVWERLRVCGSFWEHQFPYILVTPSMANGQLYVPRKASRQGFRVRSVATVGRGRRPYDWSTLPGYNTRPR